MIPLRQTIATSTAALVLVLPVVLVAVVGRVSAGIVAAVTAALAFDVLLTQPYYSLTIETADDVESAIVLGVVAVAVGTVVAREVEARTRSSSRQRELAAIRAVVAGFDTGDEQATVDATTSAVCDVLGARRCDWAPGFHGRIGAVMGSDGSIAGGGGSGRLPGHLEIPVVSRRHEHGRLIVRTDSLDPVSSEERRTVLLIADLLAAALACGEPRQAGDRPPGPSPTDRPDAG
jgi:hypothetical protein